ncbi:uncharacterized protein LOC108203846 [Daucus carota subsp. sativus]|uniref:uncharacterized protein LOC108203846 n=1 Tax=Daucus carota subsp. sativus TaxID=79200 RepID=UPI0030833DB0
MLCYCLGTVVNFLNNIDVEEWMLKERNGCRFRGKDINRFWSGATAICDHLICNGPSPHCVDWIHEVSMLRTDRVVEEMETDHIGMGLGDDFDVMIHNTYGHMTSIVRLYQVKCIHGFSEAVFTALLELIKEVFPDVNLPSSFSVAKGMIKDLSPGYQKIHACPNDCILFWAENEKLDKCTKCGTSRWKLYEQKLNSIENMDMLKESKIPAKVMRYFPLTQRLQRMFMSSDFSNSMTWHALARKKDGKLRHPAHGEGWKSMDAKYPEFAAEFRNVRLGLASDGFNPYRSMNISHSTWPVVLVINYNLPPWLIMKPENIILSTLIPGPVGVGNEIDVYMQPLLAELKELWGVGVETYDARSDSTFKLHASLLWTISDFPGYAILSVLGQLSEPNSIIELLCGYENDFGKKQKKQKGSSSNSPGKKRSIFYELPYWSSNMVRHNLDVMHIEKNLCDKILGTLLNIGGKTKDHLNARMDMEQMGIRKILHPIKCGDNKKVEIRAATFDMTKKEKEIFCSVFMNAKFPHGSVSNISRFVHMKERKIVGYKSHDAHVMLQYLLQFEVVKILKPEVPIPLMRLSAFLRGICGKVIELEDVEKLQKEIIEILCELEMIFPPAFFDIMVHLPIHLCKELEFGGPVHLRCMFGVERYLCKLKSYVRNRSKPEDSIAKGYIVDECLTYCARFFNDGGENINDPHNGNNAAGYPIGSGKNKDAKSIHLEGKIWIKAHRYILFNCDNVDIEMLKDEHLQLVQKDAKSQKFKREWTHTIEFHKWLKEVVRDKENISVELSCLAKGHAAKRFSGYVVSGYRFHTKRRDRRCTTQNSGVFVTALTTSFASAKDQNPIVGDVSYYGAIEDIIEVDYWGELTVVLFKCCWYNKGKECYGLTRVNFNQLCHKEDPFVLATQVQQVFYIEDPTDKNLHFVIKKSPKDQYSEVEDGMGSVEDVADISYELQGQVHDVDHVISWCRDDIPTKQLHVTPDDPEQNNAEIF